MEKPIYLIAVDAGGTKTEAILFTRDGTCVKRILTAGINPLVSDFDTACRACLDILEELSAGSMPEAAYIGMPALQYFGGRIEAWLSQRAPVKKLRAEAGGK